MEQREYIVEAEGAGQRIDRFLSGEDTGLSRSALQGLVAEGHVLCNGKAPAKSLKLKAGDIILLEIPDAKPIEAVPQEIPLDIIYEDAHLLVVNKPKGMVVHPAPGNPDGTLVNALLWHCKGGLSGIGGEIRPGIVHRIDKDTSGLPQPEQPAAAGRTHPGAGRRHRQPDRSCAERRGGGLHQPAVHAVRSVQFCRYLCLCWCGTLGAGHFPGGAARGYEKGPEGAVSHGAA